MTERTLEEIQYKELSDKILSYLIGTFEESNVTLTRLRDLAQKNGKYPGVGYSLRISYKKKKKQDKVEKFKYTEPSYRELYRRLIMNKDIAPFLEPDMSP